MQIVVAVLVGMWIIAVVEAGPGQHRQPQPTASSSRHPGGGGDGAQPTGADVRQQEIEQQISRISVVIYGIGSTDLHCETIYTQPMQSVSDVGEMCLKQLAYTKRKILFRNSGKVNLTLRGKSLRTFGYEEHVPMTTTEPYVLHFEAKERVAIKSMKKSFELRIDSKTTAFQILHDFAKEIKKLYKNEDIELKHKIAIVVVDEKEQKNDIKKNFSLAEKVYEDFDKVARANLEHQVAFFVDLVAVEKRTQIVVYVHEKGSVTPCAVSEIGFTDTLNEIFHKCFTKRKLNMAVEPWRLFVYAKPADGEHGGEPGQRQYELSTDFKSIEARPYLLLNERVELRMFPAADLEQLPPMYNIAPPSEVQPPPPPPNYTTEDPSRRRTASSSAGASFSPPPLPPPSPVPSRRGTASNATAGGPSTDPAAGSTSRSRSRSKIVRKISSMFKNNKKPDGGDDAL